MSQLVLKDVTYGYPDRPVLDRVALTVRPGERVCVIGENGSGKSTLLRLVAGELRPADGSVVVVADGGAGYLAQTPPLPPDATVQDAVDGALAELRDLERRIRAAEAELGTADRAGLAAYADLVAAFEARDGYRADARVEAALHGLGAAHLARTRTLGSLSGGEAARLALACVLAPQPELLLLDEPTNHLDDQALSWLEDRLRGHRGTVVAVTHDRVFLDRVATSIVEVDGDRKTVSRFGNGWHGYLEQRTALRRRWEERHRAWSDEVARQEEIAGRNADRLGSGWRMRDSSTFAKFSPHQRSVEGQISGVVRNARERLRRLRADPVPRPPDPLRFTAGDGTLDGGGHPFVRPVEVTDAVVEGRLTVDRLVLAPGSRTLVTGPNGAGKSTLLALLAGRLTPDTGSVGLPPRIGYLAQEVTHEGADRALLDVFAAGLGGPPEEHAEALLVLGLFREEDLAVPVRGLSVGQRRRLDLALLVSRPADLLLLDEPTNHVAPALVEDLDAALAGYAGTLVVVSHDRRLRERFTGDRVRVADGVLVTAAG
ncbi:ABC-F family ATP-binding cassette domain-containing protein [Streptomyces sp. VRA16 Mangrove soil]|uniref:ABC-F family ATP-binding cassette domain-containing protein n=1 Tax=Streptomyces sp. VRA16 Mangrove soil TaxID=2817434 RepID=UPI001A9E6E1A|nr:ABC-F family ATP-binding cassette domain-containing protein [Streptomyces sp. VRA16 Mangrove soil]MBO1332418.1 ABC-F family ATP-binding cassette domain-containing protein [Streptomyces sp. VRA16 Mangrove soil]